jgi:hypothetical protein
LNQDYKSRGADDKQGEILRAAEHQNTPVEYQHRQHILAILRAYRQSQVMIACTELKIFEILAEKPLDIQEISKRARITERGAELLMNTAASIGLLIKEGEQFSNSPAAQTCLGRRSQYFL